MAKISIFDQNFHSENLDTNFDFCEISIYSQNFDTDQNFDFGEISIYVQNFDIDQNFDL